MEINIKIFVKIVFILRFGLKLGITFSRYTRFGTKLALFFCLAKTSKYKTNFKLNQMPKSRVTCVMQRCDTSEKHQSSSVPIFQPNVSNFSTFQFWSLSIVGSFSVFCLSSELCFSIKIQKKKKTKKFSTFCFPQSDSHLLVFRISISDSELALRRLAS